MPKAEPGRPHPAVGCRKPDRIHHKPNHRDGDPEHAGPTRDSRRSPRLGHLYNFADLDRGLQPTTVELPPALTGRFWARARLRVVTRFSRLSDVEQPILKHQELRGPEARRSR
jgi:hypothetical protein